MFSEIFGPHNFHSNTKHLLFGGDLSGRIPKLILKKNGSCLAVDLSLVLGPGYFGVRIRSRLPFGRPSPTYPFRICNFSQSIYYH